MQNFSDKQLDKIIQGLPDYDPVATAADGQWFDYDASRWVLSFFPACIKHVKGQMAGEPYELEPHEQAITANIFGWKNKDGTRRYREVFYFVPRKNSKTTWAAGISLFVLFCDKEPGAECYCAAADREQAALLFNQADAMVDMCPEMAKRSQTMATSKTIILEDNKTTFFRAISAEAGTKHGYNSHLVIVDELHAQPNRDLVDVLETGMGSRTQPLMIHITTSDFERESICNEKHDYASKVRDGIIEDPTFLPVIYEALITDDWKDPEVWHKANPNLGKSIGFDYVERACKKAQETPAFENTFKRLHLNISTQQETRWLSIDQWDRCINKFNPAILIGRECYGGLDLASTTDIAAFVLDFPPIDEDDLIHYILAWFWIPKENAYKRERKDRVPYLTWAKQGHLTMTDGNVIDYDVIRRDVVKLNDTYNIKQLGIDRWAATQITTQFQGDGFDVVPFGQGYFSMSAPTKELEKLILGEQIAHNGNPVLRWMASNVMVEQDAAGNLKPSKAKSTEKIDGIVAEIIAIGVASARKNTTSVYEKRGLFNWGMGEAE